MPKEFKLYFEYVKGLTFSEEPNYFFLKKLFRTLFMTLKNTNKTSIDN